MPKNASNRDPFKGRNNGNFFAVDRRNDGHLGSNHRISSFTRIHCCPAKSAIRQLGSESRGQPEFKKSHFSRRGVLR